MWCFYVLFILPLPFDHASFSSFYMNLLMMFQGHNVRKCSAVSKKQLYKLIKSKRAHKVENHIFWCMYFSVKPKLSICRWKSLFHFTLSVAHCVFKYAMWRRSHIFEVVCTKARTHQVLKMCCITETYEKWLHPHLRSHLYMQHTSCPRASAWENFLSATSPPHLSGRPV